MTPARHPPSPIHHLGETRIEGTAAADGQARLTPDMRVRIMVGRFAGESGRLLSAGPESATVDLGVAIDGGNGIVVVPTSEIQGIEQ
jgi:transcription antitermination factor NusG